MTALSSPIGELAATDGQGAADALGDADTVEAVGVLWSRREPTDPLIGYEAALVWLQRPPAVEVEATPLLPAARCPECDHHYWSLDSVCTGVLTEDRLVMVEHEPRPVEPLAAVLV